MSGGSYNYLYCKDASDIRAWIDDLTGMAERLKGLGYAPRATAATERLLALLRDDDPVADAIADLADVWHAVEWCDSNDWSDDQMRAEIERYEAQPVAHSDRPRRCPALTPEGDLITEGRQCQQYEGHPHDHTWYSDNGYAYSIWSATP